jgi:glycosyltransferase involved in cell wall biosynthesis
MTVWGCILMLTVNIICKNEENNIRRCLSSVANIANYWVLVDTGSNTDFCATLAMQTLSKIPGKVIFLDEFVDYSHARNVALSNSPKDSWILSIDADEVFEGILPPLTDNLALYKVNIADGTQDFWNYRLFNNRYDCEWVGRVHENIKIKTPNTSAGQSTDFRLFHYRSGATPPEEKHRLYINLLKKDYEEKRDSRSAFYLFKTYVENPACVFDISTLLKYAEIVLNISYDNEEKYLVCFYLGDIYMQKGQLDSAKKWFIKSIQYSPRRRSSYARLMQLFFNNKDYEYAAILGDIADKDFETDYFVKLKHMDEVFWLYYGLSCYYNGRIDDAKRIGQYLVNTYPNNELHKNNNKFYFK